MMRARALATVIATLALGLGGVRASIAADIVLRSSATPEEAWVGQRVRLHIDVLAANGWAQISEMGELEIPGTYVIRTESQGTRLNETIGRTTYTGQRYELSLYCQRPGRVEVPAIPATVTVKQWGASPSEVRREVRIPTTSLTCRVPPGAEGVRGLISTSRLTATQTWSSKPDTVAPGDAITRTVELSAEDVSGMAFPPMQHPEQDGLGIYAGEPSVADVTSRGSLRGERTETVTYVFERPGEVALPGIVLPWWDTDAKRMRRIELPGLNLVVAGVLVPESAVEAAPAPEGHPRNPVLIVVAIVVAIAVSIALVLGLGHRLLERYRVWRHDRHESEPAYFKRVARALRGGNPKVISAAVMQWLDRLDTGTRPARLDVLLHDHGDEETRAAAAALAHCLATGERFTEARALDRGLNDARRRPQRSRRRDAMAASVLPELNVVRPSHSRESSSRLGIGFPSR